MNPIVSIVIPAHNAQRFIAAALHSIEVQRIDDLEVLVVDDSSTDATAEIVRRFEADDPRVRLLDDGRSRGGVAEARNSGIDAARGRYLVFLDADDWLMPGALGTLIDACERDGCAASFGGTVWFNEEAVALGFSARPTCSRAGLGELLEFNRFSIHAQCIRREALGDERFDPSLPAFEDWDLWMRIAARGVTWRAVGHDVAAYRSVRASRSRDWRSGIEAVRRIITDAFGRARSAADGPRFALDAARERRIVQRHILEAATGSAWSDPTACCDASARLLIDGVTLGTIRAADAAEAAYWSIPRAACDAPSSWRSRMREYTPPLARWWRRLSAEGWGERGFLTRAMVELAKLMVQPADISSKLAEEIDPGRPVVLLGMGQNGAALARELLGRGMSVSARDDAAPLGASKLTIDGHAIDVTAGFSDLHDTSQYIVTPRDDEAILDRLPVCLDVRRWNDTADVLARASIGRLVAVWPADVAPAQLGAAA